MRAAARCAGKLAPLWARNEGGGGKVLPSAVQVRIALVGTLGRAPWRPRRLLSAGHVTVNRDGCQSHSLGAFELRGSEPKGHVTVNRDGCQPETDFGRPAVPQTQVRLDFMKLHRKRGGPLSIRARQRCCFRRADRRRSLRLRRRLRGCRGTPEVFENESRLGYPEVCRMFFRPAAVTLRLRRGWQAPASHQGGG